MDGGAPRLEFPLVPATGSNFVMPPVSHPTPVGDSNLGTRRTRHACRKPTPGTNYYWSVQSVDTAFAGSAFAAEGIFTALADPPVTVSFVREGVDDVRATWRGTPGSGYQVFQSSDLSSWNLLASPIADTNGLFDVLESTSGAPLRFYRAARP